MTDTRLVEVAEGTCPVCDETNPGRILEHEITGAVGWECPRPSCETFTHVQDVGGIGA